MYSSTSVPLLHTTVQSVPLLHTTVQRKVAEDTGAPLMYIIQKRTVVFLDARATRRPP